MKHGTFNFTKHGTLIVLKVIAGLYHLEVIDTEKRNAMITTWNMKDPCGCKSIVSELKELTTSPVWKRELSSLEEEMEVL